MVDMKSYTASILKVDVLYYTASIFRVDVSQCSLHFKSRCVLYSLNLQGRFVQLFNLHLQCRYDLLHRLHLQEKALLPVAI